MIARCLNPTNKDYWQYGGRGITVDLIWRDFNLFKHWAFSNGYKQGLSLDRIDNNAGYFPCNCRWATAKEQANNRRNNHFITYNNQTYTIAQWGEITGMPAYLISKRLRRGWSVERALTQPIQVQQH